MSQLDQAKKEAKRLFSLAKENNLNSKENNTYYLPIENLSKAREVVSIINGYKNWHEYEQVAKKKDFIFDKKDKSSIHLTNNKIYENQKYYIQDLKFNNVIDASINKTDLSFNSFNSFESITSNTFEYLDRHKYINLGESNEKKLFEPSKKWLLNQYPALFTGSIGAGKTEIFLSNFCQHIDNNEGAIYITGKGDNFLYVKIFSYLKQKNRTNDLYLLNFLGNNLKSNHSNDLKNTHTSHSIDPINPMIGNLSYFNDFFGRLGIVIHSILEEIHKKNQLMDIQSLESILMLNNLINWNKNKTFNTPEISNYLLSIGLSLDDLNDDDDFNGALLKHSNECHIAFETVSLLKNYPSIFRVDCSINMDKIFLERKVLLVLLPVLERTSLELSRLGSLICYQIKNIEEKYQSQLVHFQNIFIDEFTYFADCFKSIDFTKSKNNYIFGAQDYRYDNDIFNYILNNAKTYVIMKYNMPELHSKIKLDLINNISEFPKISIHDKNKTFIQNFVFNLNELHPGQAYVLCNNFHNNDAKKIINSEKKFYCEYLQCNYIPIKIEKKIWIEEHPKRQISIN